MTVLIHKRFLHYGFISSKRFDFEINIKLAECDPQSLIFLRGHGKMNMYNDNNYTLSFKSFQQRNRSTSVSLMNTLLFGYFNMMAEEAVSVQRVTRFSR